MSVCEVVLNAQETNAINWS